MKVGLLLLLSLNALAGPEPRQSFDWSAVSQMAIQDRGRIKPFETFANESTLYVTNRRSWKGLNSVEVIFGWLIAFEEEWNNEPFIRVDYEPLKKAVGLEVSRNYFSPKELTDLPELTKLLRDGAQREKNREALSELDKKAREIQGRRSLVEAVASGEVITILPNPVSKGESWYPLALLLQKERLPYGEDKIAPLSNHVRGVLEGFLKKDAPLWNRASSDLSRFLRQDLVGIGFYPKTEEVEREVFYNSFRPFRLAWICYALAFCAFIAYWMTKRKGFSTTGMGVLLIGWLVHAFGFGLRIAIAGRPPVTNMYESVIWVSWGCVLFAFIVWLGYKKPIIPAAASVFSIVALVLADGLPGVLDSGIHPLEPVLRSNFWLTIHVLTITLSYAAFACSLCLGNVVLGNILFRPARTESTQEYTLYMYRAVQIGVVLLAAGTILGGVWADYSWGRFWGWDPKEVWALVALLLYLAVLHGRFTGWLRGFGFSAATVICFLGVLMAWYGVNFVLGVGLHSYGFGTGGIFWVSLYAVLQLLFIGAAWMRNRRHGNPEAPIFPRA